MAIHLPSGARKIKEILDDSTKTPEQKLADIEQVVDYKLQPKVHRLSRAHDKLRPEVIKISQQFYQKLKAIINLVKKV